MRGCDQQLRPQGDRLLLHAKAAAGDGAKAADGNGKAYSQPSHDGEVCQLCRISLFYVLSPVSLVNFVKKYVSI